MELLSTLLTNYHVFEEKRINDRFFKHDLIIDLLKSLNHNFSIEEVGHSTLGRSINLIKWGKGPIKVFLWSQMHGDEATATMALFDLMNLLELNGEFKEINELLDKKCTLYILPMLNPDGAESFTRRNAMEIDINRDFHKQQSPEAKILRQLRDRINPEFGFNLHDQSTLWSVADSGNPATISLLAPAYDQQLSINSVREKAMQVISLMNKDIKNDISGHIGRFDDEYEPRAFGDNFQAAGTSTILIEAGGFKNDPEKQFIRKIYLKSILSGLISIANESYKSEELEGYFSIPENKKSHFQLVLKNCKLQRNGISYLADIGLIAQEKINTNLKSVSYNYLLSDIGDLTGFYAYQELNCESYKITEIKELRIDEPADIIIQDANNIILTIENGRLTNLIQ
jgi:hypothetical protein